METITLISGRQQIACSNLVYYATCKNRDTSKHEPSHLVARVGGTYQLDEVCYIRLKKERVPVLVTRQPDGSVWLGGAYLDTIAREFRLIPRPLPAEMEGKTKEWLRAIGDRWQIPHDSSTDDEL